MVPLPYYGKTYQLTFPVLDNSGEIVREHTLKLSAEEMCFDMVHLVYEPGGGLPRVPIVLYPLDAPEGAPTCEQPTTFTD